MIIKSLSLLKTLNKSHYKLITRFSTTSFKNNTKNVDDLDSDVGPIKYTKSNAYRFKAMAGRSGTVSNRLWYEPYVIIGSLITFMTYFCVLREENDLDGELTKSLYSRIEGLEEQQLRASLEYNEDNNLSVKDIKDRLEELKVEKNAK